MARIKKVKPPKISVAELKRKVIIGTDLTLVKYNSEEMNRQLIVDSVSSSCFILKDKNPNPEIHQANPIMKWPKKNDLTATERGFILDTKFSVLEFAWVLS